MNYDEAMDASGLFGKPVYTTYSMYSSRVSHVLGLRGPNQTIDVGCSSSLVAINSAELSLHREQASLALAMGVCQLLRPMMFVVCCQGKMCSEHGRSLSFNTNGDGYLRGEAFGGTVIGWVPDTQKSLIFVAGSVTRQDGRTASMTAPSGAAQQMLVRDAHDRAGITITDLNASECQANGSQLGDPIECGALAAIFKRNTDRDPFVLATGKTNKGHSEGASGITGFLKMVLTMERQRIAPLIHLKILNAMIEFDGLPIIFATEVTQTPCYDDNYYMGVSAFGWGGTNAHLVGRKAIL